MSVVRSWIQVAEESDIMRAGEISRCQNEELSMLVAKGYTGDNNHANRIPDGISDAGHVTQTLIEGGNQTT